MPAWLLLPVWLWLLLAVAVPGLLLVAIALAHPATGIPPFALGWNGEPLVLALTDPLYRDALWGSLRLAGFTAVATLAIGYPLALAIAHAPAQRRPLLRALVVLPFLTGFLLRLTAWVGILRDGGVLNGVLLGVGLVGEPLRLLHTEGAMLVGMASCYLPFMVLPIEARLSAADPALAEAAADLGASPRQVFLRVTLPLSLPGVLAGVLLVAVPAAGEVVVPALLGAPDSLTLGRVIWDTFFQERDWPQAAALAVVLLALVLAPAALLRRAPA